MKKIDLTGRRYGRLIVLNETEPTMYNQRSIARYLCKCDCGGQIITVSDCLRSGSSRSCGCLAKENTKRLHQINVKHGYARNSVRSKTYYAWQDMKRRCYDPNNKKFHHYGGRGIKVCNRWLGENGFKNFLADMGEGPGGLSLERVNNNGDYEPSNCKWATVEQQNNNTRRNVLIWADGQYMTMKQFAKSHNIPYMRFFHLYRRKQFSVQEILTREGCL